MAEPGAAEDALLSELKAMGACIDAVPRNRPDGVRGLFATRDLDAEERACWVPNECVLEHSTCDARLRSAIEEALAEQGLGEAERAVYGRMIALVAGYLLEKAKGAASKFLRYVEALPPYPPTANTWSPAEREALKLLIGKDSTSAYAEIVDVAAVCVQRAAGLWGDSPVPSRTEVEAAFFFVLSRMSYMRMIPLCDLANAAMPGEENARIVVEGQEVDGRAGCAVVTKRPVKAGEEVVIDYNHHNALGMLANYGCTMGLETLRSETRVEVKTPQYLQDMAGPQLLGQGQQLCEDEPAALPEKVLLMLRMAALGSAEELVAAAKAGYFGDDGAPAAPREKLEVWNRAQAKMYASIGSFCVHRRRWLEETVGPAVKELDRSRLAGHAIAAQYETDKRLLTKCEEAMLARAASLVASAGPARPEGQD